MNQTMYQYKLAPGKRGGDISTGSEAVSKYLGSGRDPLEKDHLGCSSAEGHAHPVEQLLRRVQVLLLG